MKKGKYHDIGRQVPYLSPINEFILDRYGVLHAWYDVDTPALEVAGVGRLVEVQKALVNSFSIVPERVAQFQWSFSDSEDWAPACAAHAAYSSTNFRIVDDLRAERSKLLLDATKERRITRTSTILVISCIPEQGVARGTLGAVAGAPAAGAALHERTLKPGEIESATASLELAGSMLEDVLGRASIGLRRMDARSCASYLYRLWNPTLSRIVPVRYDYDEPGFNDAWLADDWELLRDGWRIGDQWHGFVSMNIKPEQTRPGMVRHVTTGSGVRNLRTILTVRRLDAQAQRDQIRHFRNKSMERMKENLSWVDRLMGQRGPVDPSMRDLNVEALADVEEANRAIEELRKAGQYLVSSQLVCHTWADSLEELRRKKTTLLGRMADLDGARGCSETFGTYYVTKSSMPGSIEPMPRWVKVQAPMAADLTPLSKGFETGDAPVSVFGNSSGGIVTLDLFSTRNVNAPMTFVGGATGTGKSFLINMLLFQHLIQDAMVIILDVGGSYTRLIELMGGKTLSFSGQFTFNPLQVYGQGSLGKVSDVSPQDRARIVAALESVMVQPDDAGGRMPVELVNKLDEAVEAVFKTGAVQGLQYLTLSDVHKRLSAVPDLGINLTNRLRPFVKGQMYGGWMDGPTTVDLRSDALYIDMQGISKDPRLAGAFIPVMLNFVHDIITTSKGRRKIVVFDELWQHIANPRMMDFVVGAFKTFRKEDSVVIGCSQNLGRDIADNPIVEGAVVQSTETWFLLPQGRPEQVARTAEMLDLTEGQVEILKQLPSRAGPGPDGRFELFRSALMLRGRGTSKETSGEIRISPTPREYWLATTHPEDTKFFRDTLDACGGDVRRAVAFCAREKPYGYFSSASSQS